MISGRPPGESKSLEQSTSRAGRQSHTKSRIIKNQRKNQKNLIKKR